VHFAILAAVVLWLAGHAVLALAGSRRTRSALERHAAAILIGLALGSIAPVAGAALLGPRGVPVAALALAALAGAGAVALVRRRGDGPAADATPWTLTQRAALAGILVLAGGLVFQAATAPVHTFDSTFHFSYKGALLRHEGVATAAWTELEGDVGRVQTHPGYPPGVGALQAVTTVLAKEFDASRARPLWSLFALAPAGLLFAALRSRGRWAGLCAAALWLTLPLLFYNTFALGRWPDDGWLLDGGADLPLAAFCFGGLVHLRRLAAPGLEADRADVVVAGVMLGAAALTKNEGLPLALAAALAALLAGICARAGAGRLARVGSAAALALLVAAPWLLVRGAIPAVDEAYPERIAALLLEGEGLDRWPTVAAGLARCFLPMWNGPRWEEPLLRWGLLWVVALLALAWRLKRPRALLAHPALAALLFVAGGTVLYALVLLATPWELAALFRTMIPDRLVLHLAPAGCLLAASLLWEEPASMASARGAHESGETGG
jgi:hypothetical protein